MKSLDGSKQRAPHPVPGGERRTSHRYRVREGAVAFLGTVPGSIIDISDGGIAVHYTLLEAGPPRDLLVDIFLGDDGFYLADIPVELVDDCLLPIGSGAGFIPVKRLGLRFGQLTDEQRDQIHYFIIRNTISEV